MEKPIIPDPKPTATLYTDEEAQEILSRAMGLGDEGVSRDALARMASDLGISPAELARAEAEYRASGATSSDHAAFRAHQRARLGATVTSFVPIIVFLWLFFGFIAFFVASEPMVLIPAVLATLGMGLAAALSVTEYLTTRTGPSYDAAFERWRERRQHRLERAERRRLKG